MTKTGVLNRMRSFHGETGGQLSILMVLAAVLLLALVGLVTETGVVVSRKVQAQNAADAAALSGGAWIARGLNVTSAVNVMQTQLVGGAIVLEALDDALSASLRYVKVLNKIYLGCSPHPFCVVGSAVTAFQLTVLKPLEKIVDKASDFLSECPDGLFWKFAELLEGANWIVHKTFPAIAVAEAWAVARANGSDLAVLVPGRLFHLGHLSIEALTLPTRLGSYPDALCTPMVEGSPTPRKRGYQVLHGYEPSCGAWSIIDVLSGGSGCGPYRLGVARCSKLLLPITGFPVPLGQEFLVAYAKLHKSRVCGGQADVEVKFTERQSLEECKDEGGRARWRYQEVRTVPLSENRGETASQWALFESLGVGGGGIDPSDFEGLGPTEAEAEMVARQEEAENRLRNHPKVDSVTSREQERPCAFEPDGYRRRGDTFWRTRQRSAGSAEDGTRRYVYTLELWQLAELPEVETTLDEDDLRDRRGQEDDGECPKIVPYALDDSNDGLRFLVLAARPVDYPIFEPGFRGRAPERLWTYAQVEVYNGLSEEAATEYDIYTQDWRVHLVPADLLETPVEAALQSRIGTWFQEVAGAVGGSFGFDLDWSEVTRSYLTRANNH